MFLPFVWSFDSERLNGSTGVFQRIAFYGVFGKDLEKTKFEDVARKKWSVFTNVVWVLSRRC